MGIRRRVVGDGGRIVWGRHGDFGPGLLRWSWSKKWVCARQVHCLAKRFGVALQRITHLDIPAFHAGAAASQGNGCD
ncbi:hypothetical protein NY78_2777 [Desulfovibrio sp. TomC]|nr:hypothetical protein NY78_2777 [Desulfovibrio sp. TomC]